MMLVMEVVTTALLLVAIAAAQKPTTIDKSSVNEKQQVKEEPEILHEFHQSVTLAKRHHDNQTKEMHDNISLHKYLNSEMVLSSNDYVEGRENSNLERMKRKIIFGGASYGNGGRRTSATGGDPYGRRRGHYGPNNDPHESWPYRQPDIPYVDTPMHGTSNSYGSPRGGTPTPVYDTARTAPTDPDFFSSGSSSDTYGSPKSSKGGVKKSKTGVHEMPKIKLTKNVKSEIVKFAVQHSIHQAANKFEHILGRKLALRKVEKFVKRYQKKQKKNKGFKH